MKRRLTTTLVLSLSVLLAAVPALADIPPADACDAADEGNACDNAMRDGETVSGTCLKDQCTRTTPTGSMTYECYLCKPGPSSDDGDDGGDCSMSGSSGNPALAGLPLLGLWLWNRRRRAGRK